MTRVQIMTRANDWTPRAQRAYKRRWRSDYNHDLDDTGWWKWLIGFDTGFRAGLAFARKRTAVGKS